MIVRIRGRGGSGGRRGGYVGRALSGPANLGGPNRVRPASGFRHSALARLSGGARTAVGARVAVGVRVALSVLGLLCALNSGAAAQPRIPQTWDAAALASFELPLANPAASARHVSSDYYYQIPVRPIYKSYPVYAPGREPQGYKAWLAHQVPEI